VAAEDQLAGECHVDARYHFLLHQFGNQRRILGRRAALLERLTQTFHRLAYDLHRAGRRHLFSA
jgi:hypothetical protein